MNVKNGNQLKKKRKGMSNMSNKAFITILASELAGIAIAFKAGKIAGKKSSETEGGEKDE